MAAVFLILRFVLGGWFAWQGARRLDTYGRAGLVADAHARGVPVPIFAVPLSGLMLTIGGVSIVTGVLPNAGVALLIGVLLPAAFLMHAQEGRRFWRNVALAIVVLAFLAVPQPWPMSLVR